MFKPTHAKKELILSMQEKNETHSYKEGNHMNKTIYSYGGK
jgi:hypothetical protein